MHKTFAESFANLWDVDWVPYTDAEKLRYIEKYGFPLLPGIERDFQATIQTVHSRQPSAPEFDSVNWSEGRLQLRSPGSSSADGFHNYLITYIDIDNDGTIDTVTKNGFNEGYRSITAGWAWGEYIDVWRGKRMEFTASDTLWSVLNEGEMSGRPMASIVGDVPPLSVAQGFRVVR
ncbi:MAG: hypothetical protein ABL964_05130 [Steroidobacteraceae bacterium]